MDQVRGCRITRIDDFPIIPVGEFKRFKLNRLFPDLIIDQPSIIVLKLKPISAIVPINWFGEPIDHYFPVRKSKEDWKFVNIPKFTAPTGQSSYARVEIWDELYHPVKAKPICWLFSYNDFKEEMENAPHRMVG